MTALTLSAALCGSVAYAYGDDVHALGGDPVCEHVWSTAADDELTRAAT